MEPKHGHRFLIFLAKVDSNMSTSKLITELMKSKTKKLTMAFNPKLGSLFNEAVTKDGLSSTAKLEELILQYLDKKRKLK